MSLVQLAVSVACRSTVKAYCENSSTQKEGSSASFWQQLLEFGTTVKGEKLYAACMGTFVREGTKASTASPYTACRGSKFIPFYVKQ